MLNPEVVNFKKRYTINSEYVRWADCFAFRKKKTCLGRYIAKKVEIPLINKGVTKNKRKGAKGLKLSTFGIFVGRILLSLP